MTLVIVLCHYRSQAVTVKALIGFNILIYYIQQPCFKIESIFNKNIINQSDETKAAESPPWALTSVISMTSRGHGTWNRWAAFAWNIVKELLFTKRRSSCRNCAHWENGMRQRHVHVSRSHRATCRTCRSFFQWESSLPFDV